MAGRFGRFMRSQWWPTVQSGQKLVAVRASEAHDLRGVVRVRRQSDHGGSLVDHQVERPAGLVVTGVIRAQDFGLATRAQRGDVDRRGFGHAGVPFPGVQRLRAPGLLQAIPPRPQGAPHPHNQVGPGNEPWSRAFSSARSCLSLAWCSYPVWKSNCCWMDKHPMSRPFNVPAVKASGG
jgi:hypothetical protein